MKKHSQPIKKIIFLTFFLVIIIISIAGLLLYSFGYHPPILMYHHIQDLTNGDSRLFVSPKSFEQQMEFLKENKYSVIGLETLFDNIQQQKPIPYKTVALTFDDGYADNYLFAYPILKKNHFPATIFLAVSFIGTNGYLTWPQIQEMENNNIHFGNHTWSHQNLKEIPQTYAEQEIFKAKDLLSHFVKNPSSIFCYPVGAYNDTVKELVQAAGYRAAVSNSPNGEAPLTDRYAYRRIRISNSSNNKYIFSAEISGYYSSLSQLRKKKKHLTNP